MWIMLIITFCFKEKKCGILMQKNEFIQPRYSSHYMKSNMTSLQDVHSAFNICVLHSFILVLQTYIPKNIKTQIKMATHRAREDCFSYQKLASLAADTHYPWLGEIVDWYVNMKLLSSLLKLTHNQSFDLQARFSDSDRSLKGRGSRFLRSNRGRTGVEP